MRTLLEHPKEEKKNRAIRKNKKMVQNSAKTKFFFNVDKERKREKINTKNKRKKMTLTLQAFESD